MKILQLIAWFYTNTYWSDTILLQKVLKKGNQIISQLIWQLHKHESLKAKIVKGVNIDSKHYDDIKLNSDQL